MNYGSSTPIYTVIDRKRQAKVKIKTGNKLKVKKFFTKNNPVKAIVTQNNSTKQTTADKIKIGFFNKNKILHICVHVHLIRN